MSWVDAYWTMAQRAMGGQTQTMQYVLTETHSSEIPIKRHKTQSESSPAWKQNEAHFPHKTAADCKHTL